MSIVCRECEDRLPETDKRDWPLCIAANREITPYTTFIAQAPDWCPRTEAAK
jgi:hypothetical protein